MVNLDMIPIAAPPNVDFGPTGAPVLLVPRTTVYGRWFKRPIDIVLALDDGFRLAGSVHESAEQDDPVGHQDQRDRDPPAPAPHDEPACSIRRARFNTSSRPMAMSPRTRKNRYLGIQSHHQSKNLV